MADRKYIRLALSQEDVDAFRAAKSTAEEKTGIAMSDAMFALSVLRHAIRARLN